jgi:hypothetical protein
MGEKSRAGQQSPMSLWELYLLVLARDKAVTHWMRHQLAPGMAWERSGGEGRDYTACTTGWHSYNFLHDAEAGERVVTGWDGTKAGQGRAPGESFLGRDVNSACHRG